MPVNKPIFREINAALAEVRTIDFRPTGSEISNAECAPLDKEHRVLLGLSLGGTANLRRSRRAAREGRDRDARLEYMKGAAKCVAAVPLAPAALLVGVAMPFLEPSGRSAVGQREDALYARLCSLTYKIHQLEDRHVQFFSEGVGARDLADVSDTIQKTMEGLKRSIKERGVRRLQVSKLLADGIAAVDATERAFTHLANQYVTRLQHWAAVAPNLVDANQLEMPTPQVRPASPEPAAPAFANDGTVTLKTASGEDVLDVCVNVERLCAHSSFFQRLYHGAMAQPGQSQQATLIVADLLVAKDAIVAITADKAPEFTQDNFLSMYALFDMWDCEKMMQHWRCGIANYLRKADVREVFERVHAESPGSQLHRELWEAAWKSGIRLPETSFLPEVASTGSCSFFDAESDAWSIAERHADELHVDIRWRVFEPLPQRCTLQCTGHGLGFDLNLVDGSREELDVFRLQVELQTAPVQPVNISRLLSTGLRGLFGVQEVQFLGDANGFAFDKTQALHRTMQDSGELSPDVYGHLVLANLGAHGLVEGQSSPLYADGFVALRLRATICGCFTFDDLD